MNHNASDAGAAEPAMVESALNGRGRRLSDRGLFLKKFLVKGRTISSAVPSSQAMCQGVLESVDFGRPGTIVELGAGTGPVTEAVLTRLRAHHRFVTVENDPDFCEVLRRRFPETPLIQSDATQIAEPLARMGIHTVDYVLSGLPTPSLSIRAMVRLWRWLQTALAPNGQFIQITVAPVLYRRFYKRLFESVDYRMVWSSIPPGGVYRCARPRRHLIR